MYLSFKRFILGLSLLLLILGAAHTCFAYNVVVVKGSDIPPYNEALEGFRAVLNEKGIAVEESTITLDEISGNTAEIGPMIRKEKPSLILTFGSEATKTVSRYINDIPVVFCMVLDPVEEGFIASVESSGNNLTGASMNIPFDLQFETIKKIFPNKKRIGVLYNPSETAGIIKNASEIAGKQGLQIVALPVGSAGDIPDVMKDLGNKVDILWAVADRTVLSPQSTSYIILSTLREKIPFIGLSPYYTKAGAMVSFVLDYKDIGKQAGESASLLLAGKAPKSVPVVSPRKVGISINLSSAKALDIEVPSSIIKGAEEVISD